MFRPSRWVQGEYPQPHMPSASELPRIAEKAIDAAHVAGKLPLSRLPCTSTGTVAETVEDITYEVKYPFAAYSTLLTSSFCTWRKRKSRDLDPLLRDPVRV